VQNGDNAATSQNTHTVNGNEFLNCTGGSKNVFSDGGNFAAGGGGGGGFTLIFAGAASKGSSSSNENNISIANNTFRACAGGSGSISSTKLFNAGAGGGGGFAVTFANSGQSGGSSDGNILSISNNKLSTCTGGSSASFLTFGKDGNAAHGGGGGGGGFGVIYANVGGGFGRSSSDHNTLSISNNTLSACTGGNNITVDASASNSGGGGGGGGFALIFANGAEHSSSSSSDSNTVSIVNNVLSTCTGGNNSTFDATSGAGRGGGGGSGGFGLIFANAANKGGASSDGNSLSVGNNTFNACVGGSSSAFSSSAFGGGGGGGGGAAMIFANAASDEHGSHANANNLAINGNTFRNCTGGSSNTFSTTSKASGGGGGGGGIAVIFANVASSGAGSDRNTLLFGSNALAACTGGSSNVFKTSGDPGSASGGGGGSGGFGLIYANGGSAGSSGNGGGSDGSSSSSSSSSSSDGNVLSIGKNAFSECEGGNNNTFNVSGNTGGGGGGGGGGLGVIFAHGAAGSSSSDAGRLTIDNNVFSACTGGGSNSFTCSHGLSVCGSGGGSGGALVAFASAGSSSASASHTSVSATLNRWAALSVKTGARCPGPGALCGTSGALAVLFTAPGTSVTNTTATIAQNRVDRCSASGVTDSTTAGSGAAAGFTVMYFQSAPVLTDTTHVFKRNSFTGCTAEQHGSALRLLLGAGVSNNAASFTENAFTNNSVACGAGQACSGGSVVVSGGRTIFDGDSFSGNTAEEGAAADLYVTASGTADLSLARVTFAMTASTMGTAALSTGVAVSKAAQPSQGASFSCPLGFSVTTVTSVAQATFGCHRCAPSLYLAQNGTLDLDGNGQQHACAPCPFGGDCTKGGAALEASGGYWGSASANGSVSFILCPSGLCCRGGGCAWDETCSDLFRDNAVPLCGACKAGFSATVGSSTCRKTTDCNDTSWFVPLFLLLALLWTQAVLLAGASAGGGSRMSRAAEVAQLVMYFYQMAPLLPVGKTHVDEALSFVAGILNVQLHTPSAHGFACPFPGLTMLQEIALEYVMPALVGAMLLLRYHCERRARNPKHALSTGCTAAAHSRSRFAKALPPLVATAFTTLLITTFKLLHCVSVGDERVIFRAAGFSCDQWWRAPLFLIAVILLLPVVVTLTARASPAVSAWCAARPWQRTTWATPLVAKLQAPFVGGCWHWAAMLALQRLVVVGVYTFVGETVSRAVSQVLVMGCSLMLHTASRPFVHPASQHVQTALLVTLTLVAVINAPLATLQTSAVEPLPLSPMHGIADQLKVAEAVLLVFPGALFVLMVLAATCLEVAKLSAVLQRKAKQLNEQHLDSPLLDQSGGTQHTALGTSRL
jgi:hypothetical protein